MSSAGQIVGGAIGGVVGFFNPVLGTALGAQLGMMVGGLIDPPKGPTVTGPRLTDLTIQTSTYGAVIPRLYGTTSVHGNVFWLENNKIKETVVKKKSGGKGGPKTTTKTYVNTATFALGLCRGPIAGVRRIWISGKLYYDAGSTDTDTIIASNQAASGFTVHTGTDTQLPDTRMQATLGAANTPAWRGLAYIVFNDLPLADYGDALAGAQVKVEIVQTATYGDDQHSYTPPSSRWLGLFRNNGFLWSVGGESMALGNQVCYSSDGGQNWTTNTALDFTSNWIAAGANSNMYLALAGYGDGRVTRSTNLTSWTTVSGPDAWWRNIIVNGSTFLCFGGSACYTTTDGVNFTSGTNPSSAVATSMAGAGTYNGYVYAISLDAVAGVAKIAVSTTGVNGWTETVVAGFDQTYGVSTGPAGMLISSGSVPTLSGKHCITTSVDNGATWSPYIELPFANSNLHNVVWNGTQYVALELNYNYFYTSPDLVAWERHTTIQGGLYYGPPVWDGAYWNHLRNNGTGHASTFIKFRTGVMSASTNAVLGDIVRAECMLSNVLDSGDITSSGLTSEVRGYLVGSVGTLRNALVPLQAAWPFDVVQRGYKLEFLPRGGSSVATILSDDLDARPDTGKPGVQITMPREMDTQLPRVLTIKYLDYDREYDVGEQYAERLNTDSVNEEVQELPIVMLASEAAGKAEVLLYVRWMERTDVSVVVPGTYNHLEVGDTVTLQTPEGNVAIRITAANYTSDGRVEIKAKFAHSAVYTPAALGVPSVVSGVSTIPSSGPSRYVLLDVPYMDTVQSTPGFLATMYGGSGWPGGVIVRTDDGGTTWTDVQAFDSAGGTVGSASNTIGVVDSRVWDKTSVLSVTMNNGTLSSATEAAVLNGGNYFAYGVDGRWEIIAAQTCTLVSGSTYTLQNLLRGRFGTEWAMGLHAAGDTIVVLNTSDVTAIGMSSSSIGLSRAYRAITYDQDISSDSDMDFTYRGVNLECLSPVFFNGTRDPFTNVWTFSLIRRSRTDGEWRDLVDVGLGETSEAYEMDIFSTNSFATVKRTLTSATPGFTYAAADQVADFGSVQDTVHAKVYQMSSVVGRGYPAISSFTAANATFYDLVVLQLPMSGAIGSTTFTDLKGKSVTASNSAHASANGLYGSSCYFDGSGDYLSLSSTNDFDLGSGAMTIEFWVYRESHLTDARVLQFGPNGSASSCQVNFRSDGGIWFFPAVGSPASGFSVGAGNYSLSTWTHIAFVLTSTTAMRLYVNGVEKYNSTASAFPSASYQLSVGGDSGLDLKGNVCGLRITKGVARYTAAFTPPSTMHVEGASDPYWANVVLSMPLISNTSDTNGKSVSVNGTPAISSARSPYARCATFNGTNSRLTVTNSADFNFGTGDFCIEAWVYIAADSAADLSGFRSALVMAIDSGAPFAKLEFIIQGNASVTGTGLQFGLDPGSGYVSVSTSTSISKSAWHLIEVTRASGVVTFFVDGSNVGGGPFAYSVGSSADNVHIGGRVWPVNYNFWLNGYVGPIRVTKGVARHTLSYSPASPPFPTS